MDKLKFILKISILFLLFIPQISQAKSTNKNKFMNEYKKGVDLLKSEKKLTINSFKIFVKLENNYDLSKINLKKNIRGNFFYYLCDGYAIFKKQEQKKIISFCLKADKIFLNQNYYEKKNWSYVKYHLADLIGMYSSWRYYLYGDKKDLRVAKKYIERNKILKKSDKFQDIYINNLKNQSILYRANLNIKKAIKNHEDILNALNCFNSREVQKKERLCDEEKLNYSVLLMDTGKEKNFEKAKIILDEIYKNENQKNFNLDNRRSVRINYYAYYLNKYNLEDAEKFLFDSIQYIKNIEERGGKEDYYDILDRLYGLNIIQGNFNDALKGLEKLIKDIEKDFGSNSPILMGPYSNILRIYTDEYNNLKKAKFYKDKVEVLLKNNPRIKLDRDVIYARVGNYYRKKNEPKKSEPYYEKALKFNNEMAKDYSMILAYNKILLKKFNDAEKLINNFKASTSYDEIMHLSAKEFLSYEKKDMEEYKKISVDLYQYYSDYSRGIIKGAGNPNTVYYSKNILNFISHIFSLDNKDYLRVSNYFKKQTGMDIKVAIIELFEIIRSSKFNSRVQNVIDRSSNKIVENDKRRLQDLIIEFEKIPKFSKSISKSEENLNKAVQLKNEIFSLREKIKSKLNISSIPEFEKKISINDLRDNIGKKQVIISYCFDDKDLYIKFISKDNLSFKKIRNTNTEIKTLIKNILISLSLKNRKEVKNFDFVSSKKLYDIVIKPFEENLKFANELTIISHSSLISIPFEVLVSEIPKNKNNYKDAQWMVKDYSISYYPSLYSFNYFNAKKFESMDGSFIGFGNPTFNKIEKKTTEKINYSNLMLRGIANPNEIRKLSPLPETEEELNNIAKIFKTNSKLYLGNQFNEKNIKAINFKNYEYIVFATHAVVANTINNISEPGLILTPPEKSTLENDGILTISEIEKLKLNASIVILSACNTASEDGSPNGEGLSGLTSAFFQAGTKSMLVTHWDVETNSAVKLTTGSLKNMESSESLSKALQKTKISMINNKDTAHPFYWAPFVLIGNL